MSRIATPATVAAAPTAAQPLLNAVNAQLGSVPNLFRLVANSPAALKGYLGLNGALGRGQLDARTRGRLALTVAEVNGCAYCLSAHTYLGRNVVKLDDDEMDANRDGTSSEPKADAAVRFAAKVTRARGHVSDADVQAVKAAGYTDAQIVEIIAHVALNTLTNYVNTALATEIDFPLVAPRPAYDGLCAVAVSMGERVPADASSTSRHDGRTFRFSSPEAKAMFDADPAGYAARADARWPSIR